MATKPLYRKLNNNTRDEITLHALNRFDQENVEARKKRPWMKELSPEQLKLHDAVYKEVYPAAERARMNRLPEGWLPQFKHLVIHVKSLRHDGHESIKLVFSEPKPVFFSHAFVNNEYSYREWAGNHKAPTVVGPKVSILAEDEFLKNNWYKQRGELQSKIGTFLGQCKTCEQLLEKWPEVKDIVPVGFFLPEPVGTAIVVQSMEINAILGL